MELEILATHAYSSLDILREMVSLAKAKLSSVTKDYNVNTIINNELNTLQNRFFDVSNGIH